MARELDPDPVWDVLYKEGIASYDEILQKSGTQTYFIYKKVEVFFLKTLVVYITVFIVIQATNFTPAVGGCISQQTTRATWLISIG